MFYKKYPIHPKRLLPNNFGYSYNPGYQLEHTKEVDQIIDIPLPNDPEPDIHVDDIRNNHYKNPITSFINTVKTKIELEDIILIGLILLLIYESVEDEILLIILVYIFISGFGQKCT